MSTPGGTGTGTGSGTGSGTLGISAILPVRNGAALVAEAIRSIRAQQPPVEELIVVDDGSTDATADCVRRADPAARLLRQAPLGPAAARNAGAAAARGAWLAFLDHDDLWPPGRQAALLAGLHARPEAGLLCGRLQILALPGGTLDARLRQADGAHLPFLLASGLLRRSLWQAVGGMRPARDRAEDIDLYLRLLEAGATVATIEATTLVYRQHGDNRSRAAALTGAALLAAMQAAVLRRRRGAA
ncbi:glycosyl transferase family 2 [Humitalea rosea]|uniref:Glycosyl transferase family 2 n=1 Tax=Humitalea rosea TaxID=990373 RepID=A0A2W7HXS6_9PROT|nr:glycosyltransferase family A protein [Humitalea rosea]PZW36955.1 glycosyl transferase family 2 [Humitalea rosea]